MAEEKIESDVTPKEEKITEEVVITKKDPKRVEQGKRLAAISKEAKEKKMRERIREEEFSYLPYLSYGFSVISFLGFFYYFFSSGEKKEELHPMTIIRETKKTPKKNFETF